MESVSATSVRAGDHFFAGVNKTTNAVVTYLVLRRKHGYAKVIRRGLPRQRARWVRCRDLAQRPRVRRRGDD